MSTSRYMGWPLAPVIMGWLLIAMSIASLVLVDHRLSAIGREDLADAWSSATLFLVPVLSSALVGSALIVRRPGHPVGWLFLALGVVITASGAIDGYAAYGAAASRGSLPAADFVAVLGDLSFIPWLVLLALILLLTPAGKLEGRSSRAAAIGAIGGGVLAFVAALFEPYDGDHRGLGVIHNPLELEALGDLLKFVSLVGIVVLHIALLGSVALLLLRFRSARGPERQQLRWLALAAIPFPLLVIGAFIAATLGNVLILGISAAGFVAVIPIAAALAIEQHHLYDVDRLLSRGLTYSLLTAIIVATYAVVVIFVGESLGGLAGGSQVPAVAGTLVAIAVAAPARRWLQDGLDRRFNRRRFDAISAIRRYVREPPAEGTIEACLASALGDPGIRVAYWLEDRHAWVRHDGSATSQAPGSIEVRHHAELVACVSFTPSRCDARSVEAALLEARPEMENERLRAAIGLQLIEVRESRGRIVTAQSLERRRIERNLHDGAQQRLLALALQLRAAEVSGDAGRIEGSLGVAVRELQEAVRELRDLANGLCPPVLADGGLGAALDELAARTPVAVRLSTITERLPSEVEETAWFIACEALANAVKHSRAETIAIRTLRQNGHLRLEVEDDGVGGADPDGHGLRGLADRAEAAGGRMTVHPAGTRGTLVVAELPCE